MLGKIEGRRRRGRQKMRWFEGITDSMDMNMSKLQEIVENRGAWRLLLILDACGNLTDCGLGGTVFALCTRIPFPQLALLIT